MTYLNVVEVESALSALASAYPTVTELIALPYTTYEGRTSHALRIGHDSVHDGVLFTACAHAREWGGAEVCVYFAADLLEAYANHTGLIYGGTSFGAHAVQRIVDHLSVFVVPCLNPDGRNYDQLHDALWRKNRNPASSGGDPSRIGVDLNRNHPWLWDFRTAFDPGAMSFGTLASDNASSELFHGASAGSEPEGHNVRWLLDRYRFIRYFMDIHSYSGDVLFVWGDDSDQSVDPNMNFRNHAYDGQRGVGGGYGEYIPPRDLSLVQGVAQRVANAITKVRGQSYAAIQSVSLRGSSGTVSYPTSGTVDDYAYSRHFTNCCTGKVFAFTLEFGLQASDTRTSFHPPWPQMEKIVADADAGLVELCVAALPVWVPPWIIWFRRLSPWEIYGPLARFVGEIFGPIAERVRGLLRRSSR